MRRESIRQIRRAKSHHVMRPDSIQDLLDLPSLKYGESEPLWQRQAQSAWWQAAVRGLRGPYVETDGLEELSMQILPEEALALRLRQEMKCLSTQITLVEPVQPR